MIAQGTNGVSCGSFSEGVMTDQEIFSFVPLHLSAREASPTLEGWVQTWAPCETEFLTPDGWYERGHAIDSGSYHTNLL
eukprot:3597849-Ditylum_brightwellii.AAC.1